MRTQIEVPYELLIRGAARNPSFTMADYSKWKVNDLKAELKRRGIPQTGLRVKQNFIDKLLEAETGGQPGEATEGAPAAPEPTDTQDTAEQEKEEEQPAEPEQQQQPTPDVPQDPKPDEHEAEESKLESEQESATENGDVEAHDEPKPAEPTAEETPRDEKAAEAPADQPMTDAVEHAPEQEKLQENGQAELSKEAQRTPEEAEPQPEKEAPPVEQAPGGAAAPEPTPAVGEPEGAEPSAKAPESSAEPATAPPTEEVIEDTRKRKRRSQSPLPTPGELANKKAKAQEETPRVMLPEDQEGLSTEEQLVKNQLLSQEAGEKKDGIPTSAPEEPRPRKGAPPKHDARFKGLFAGTEREQARPVSPPPDTETKDVEVEPALHVATEALYIGGLMRPLQPASLRNHLVSLASAPGTSPNADVILNYYLDNIKTHCFVSFANVSAASRVRSALHGTIWPNERNRKALFVDFIPPQKLQQWAETEEGSRSRGGPMPRWEVRYDRNEDGVEAVLGEIDPKNMTGNPPPRSRQESSIQDGGRAPPLGPRADRERFPLPPPQADYRPARPGQGFKPLDELFKSTTTKPKLYYLPVSRETADRRLDRFDDLLRKGDYPRRGGDETRRISFEDEDYFVDNGPEFAGGGGGGGGGRSGRRRGRGRGRGGGGFGGDSWRG